MAESDSRLVVHQEGDVTVIEFLDRNILEESSIQQISDEMLELIAKHDHPKLLINFENVDHLSSAALGTLIRANTKVTQKKGQVRLCNISSQIYEVFVITKLYKLFEIDKSVEEATRKFK